MMGSVVRGVIAKSLSDYHAAKLISRRRAPILLSWRPLFLFLTGDGVSPPSHGGGSGFGSRFRVEASSRSNHLRRWASFRRPRELPAPRAPPEKSYLRTRTRISIIRSFSNQSSSIRTLWPCYRSPPFRRLKTRVAALRFLRIPDFYFVSVEMVAFLRSGSGQSSPYWVAAI